MTPDERKDLKERLFLRLRRKYQKFGKGTRPDIGDPYVLCNMLTQMELNFLARCGFNFQLSKEQLAWLNADLRVHDKSLALQDVPV